MSGAVQFKKRSGARKAATRTKASTSDDEDDADTQVKVAPSNRVATTVRKNGIISGSSDNCSDAKRDGVAAVYESSREVMPHKYAGADAAATHEIDTAHDRDRRAILERNGKDTNQIASSKMGGTFGPMRAPSFLRSTSRFDYCPDICKDYKETGFCGYGDNCKFLHDRGDYKSGWQMEKEWEEQQASKKRRLESAMEAMHHDLSGRDGGSGADAELDEQDEEENFEIAEEEEFPFACFICRQPFSDPVVTLCGHYFCQECAMQRVRDGSSSSGSGSRCAVCDKQTFGVFNKARKLIRYMKSVNRTSAKTPGTATRNSIDSNDNNDEDNSGSSSARSTIAPARSKGSWEVLPAR